MLHNILNNKLNKFLKTRERVKYSDYPFEVIITSIWYQKIDDCIHWVNEQEEQKNLIKIVEDRAVRIRFAKEETKTLFYLRWGYFL